MQMCPECDKVYDESEYTRCPYCSGELDDSGEEPFKYCPNCDGTMYWFSGNWECSNCGHEDYSSIDDNDGVIER